MIIILCNYHGVKERPIVEIIFQKLQHLRSASFQQLGSTLALFQQLGNGSFLFCHLFQNSSARVLEKQVAKWAHKQNPSATSRRGVLLLCCGISILRPRLRCPIKSSGLRLSSVLSTAAQSIISLHLPPAALDDLFPLVADIFDLNKFV